jgi:hypothetical protein
MNFARHCSPFQLLNVRPISRLRTAKHGHSVARQATASSVLVATLLAGIATSGQVASAAPAPAAAVAAPAPTQAAPPLAQSYVEVRPPAQMQQGQTLVPINFLSDGLGASTGMIATDRWRIVYFGRVIDVFRDQQGAIVDGQNITLPVPVRMIGNTLYVPWNPIADTLGVDWSRAPNEKPAPGKPASTKTIFLLQYPAAYIQSVHHSVEAGKVRVVCTLSNATRIRATQNKSDLRFNLAAARVPGVPTLHKTHDYMVPYALTNSGNWQASVTVRMNYAAPVQWFTIGSPPRLVIDIQRLFEEQNSKPIGGGLSLTRIRRGTPHGPVQMFAVRVDPDEGWRLRIAPAGTVLSRARPSAIARSNKALVAINGGFFAYDGAAVGAVWVRNEWIRLPWRGRTAVGFKPDGTARIDNLQTQAWVDFSGGLRLPIRDLNGWPDTGRVTAITYRFSHFYKLRPGEMAVVVKKNQVLSKPGGGGVNVPPDGFILVASGGARPWLDQIKRGERASLNIRPVGWEGYWSALGGGPRLVNGGRIEVTASRENFRADVAVGLGPRTALGVDKNGRYILLVVDGRQGFYSTGLTLTELAYTMQKLGAVDALNLDGGGSTVMVVKGRVVNRPSDGTERSVSNALLVMR